MKKETRIFCATLALFFMLAPSALADAKVYGSSASPQIANYARVNYPMAMAVFLQLEKQPSCQYGWQLVYVMENIGNTDWSDSVIIVVDVSADHNILFMPNNYIDVAQSISGSLCATSPVVGGNVYEVQASAYSAFVNNIQGSLNLNFPLPADGKSHKYSTYPDTSFNLPASTIAYNWKQSLQEGSPTIWNLQATNLNNRGPVNFQASISWGVNYQSWNSNVLTIQPASTFNFSANNNFHMKCGSSLVEMFFSGSSLPRTFSNGSWLQATLGFDILQGKGTCA